MKIVDLNIIIDGLLCESVDDYIKQIEKITNSSYEIVYEVLYEEDLDGW